MIVREILKAIGEVEVKEEEVETIEVELPMFYNKIIGNLEITARIDGFDFDEREIDYSIIDIKNNLQGLMVHTPCTEEIDYLDLFFQGMVETFEELGVFDIN